MTRGRGRANRSTKRRAVQGTGGQPRPAPSENVDPNQQNPSQPDEAELCACKEEVADPETAATALGTISSLETPVSIINYMRKTLLRFAH